MSTSTILPLTLDWVTPTEIAADGYTKWDKIRIYRSGYENSGYMLIQQNGVDISQINSYVSGAWVTTWPDPTIAVTDGPLYYYLIRYYSLLNNLESKYYLAFKSMTPRELRMVNTVKGTITPWVVQFLTDDDIRAGIILAANAINIYPPVTGFTVNEFPTSLEPLLIPGAAIFSLMFKYLGVAVTDLSYSDQGFNLNLDRGAKVKAAVDMLMGYYKELLMIAKMDYAFTGTSVGTLMLPISTGSKLSGSLLNILDIFQSFGR